MESLDAWIAGLGDGGLGLALAVALLLGLRHATDPDHLTAVSTLVLSDARRGTRRAILLGLARGAARAVRPSPASAGPDRRRGGHRRGDRRARDSAVGALAQGLLPCPPAL